MKQLYEYTSDNTQHLTIVFHRYKYYNNTK